MGRRRNTNLLIIDSVKKPRLYCGMSDFVQNSGLQELQFQHAEPLPGTGSADAARKCVACKQPIGATYFHARGHVVCPTCAQRIQSRQQAPQALSLGRAFLYGSGAALGGCILYATVAILTGFEFGLMAIVAGIMVGKAIRYASKGLGGRPQQILALALTYFAITTSYIPVFIYHSAKNHQETQSQQAQQAKTDHSVTTTARNKPPMSLGVAAMYLLLLAAVAPFLSLGSGLSGLLSLFIISIGLRQAWRLTGRSQILVMGPYETAAAA